MSLLGKDETDSLKKNLEDQLDRLMKQLEDLEECRDDLDPSEYEETKNDTIEQLKELNESLQKMLSGNISLINDLGAMQLATQAAISAAFKTPAVIRMFGKKEPKQLRERLEVVERDSKLGRIDKETSDKQKAEILSALKHLGETLSPVEIKFLQQINLKGFDTTSFVQVSDNTKENQAALDVISKEVNAYNQK
ncbi:protein LZIC-like [Chelonus insularis]|uniref:protein LZIC-like n=1 Tax=Chelonus insularis TaxID=460826 RepID=UPI001589A664|nr:protein LZIC-like [Chelonus insularis]